MVKAIFLLVLLLTAQMTFAALAPKYQNMKDLDVIVEFIKKHEKILSTLETIDFENYTIHYRNGCKAIFGRKDFARLNGWVGPADPLEFMRSTCSVDY
ncbi:MAG: hypothetical protein GY814_16665 [Gammaproteobacteria bacterium]|nr:hypothetical protein [Gammaproteobacteria bacterium]